MTQRDISGRDNRWSALFRTRAGPGKRTSPRLPSRFLAKIAVCRCENDPRDPRFDPWNRVTEGGPSRPLNMIRRKWKRVFGNVVISVLRFATRNIFLEIFN